MSLNHWPSLSGGLTPAGARFPGRAGTSFQKAGVKPGDIILEFNGQSVGGASQLKNMVGQTKPGASAKLKIWRDKKTMTLDITIAERTAKALGPTGPKAETSAELGIAVDKVPPAVASKLNFEEGIGLVIEEVDPSGKGASMGLIKGDIILELDGKPVSDVSEFNKEVQQAKKAGIIRFLIQRGPVTLYLAEGF